MKGPQVAAIDRQSPQAVNRLPWINLGSGLFRHTHKLHRDGIQRRFPANAHMEVVFVRDLDSTECRPCDVTVLSIDAEQAHLFDDSATPYDRGDNVPLLVLPSVNDVDLAAESIRAGALGYLLRDAGPEALVNGIRAVHSGSVVISSRVATAYLALSTSLDERKDDQIISLSAISLLTVV